MTLILTCNPKTKRDPNIETYIGQIKNQYPSVEKVETMFKEFHALLFGKDETKLDEYLEKYSESKIESFCKGIKKDDPELAIVKAAKVKADEIKSSAYALGKAPEHLTEKQQLRVSLISSQNPRLYRAYLLKEQLR